LQDQRGASNKGKASHMRGGFWSSKSKFPGINVGTWATDVHRDWKLTAATTVVRKMHFCIDRQKKTYFYYVATASVVSPLWTSLLSHHISHR
jgi:hypothetical protein